MKAFTPCLLIMLSLSFTTCRKDSAKFVAPKLNSISCTGGACIGYTMCFSASAQGVTSYQWNLGNGTTSTDAAPCTTYADTGLYTINLTINNDAVLTKEMMIYVSKVPAFTYLVNGTKICRHTTGRAFSNGSDTTFPATDASVTFTYVNPITILVGADTFHFSRTIPQYDSILYYTLTFTNNSGHSTSKSVRLHHTATADSIHYSIFDQQSAGGATTEDFYTP